MRSKNLEVRIMNDEQIKKIKIVNSPKNHPAWIAVSISLVIFLWTIFWSVFVYNKSLPLKEANIILETNIVQHIDNELETWEFSLKNIGKIVADDINFKIFTVLLGSEFDDFYLDKENRRIRELFDTKLINELPPDTSMLFGNLIQDFSFTYKFFGIKEEIDLQGKQIVLIYFLDYSDLNHNDRNYEKVYFFHKRIGSNQFYAMINDNDYNRIKQIIKSEAKRNVDINKIKKMIN